MYYVLLLVHTSIVLGLLLRTYQPLGRYISTSGSVDGGVSAVMALTQSESFLDIPIRFFCFKPQ